MADVYVYAEMRATADRILRQIERRHRALEALADAVDEHVNRPGRDPELYGAWRTYLEATR